MEPISGGGSGLRVSRRANRAAGAKAWRVRYFLPKTGSSSERPELGEEAASEAEAMIEAFRTRRSFIRWSPGSRFRS